MAAYVAGDQAAFRELFLRYSGVLLSLLGRHVAVRGEAADLVQQTFLQLHRARHDFDPTRRLRPWLVTIAMNLRREQMRRLARRPDLLPQAEAFPDIPAEERSATRVEVGQLVRRALEELPSEQREAIELHWVAGLPFQEVGQVMGISSAAARGRAHRGYVRLREILAVLDDDSA